MSVTNDGPGNISLIVNDQTAYTDTIKPGETRPIDMVAKGKIKRLEVQVTVATTIRIAAVR